MRKSTIAFYILVAEICGIAVLAIAAAVAAQAAEPAEDAAIVVEAPRALPLPPPAPATRDGFTGAPTVTTTVRISALYGDLDLSQPAQAARLTTRVERVARDACATLDRLYPLNPDADCVSRTVARAMPSVEAIVAAAQK
ncbi:UrcA family protein [Novosphingobium sp. JCM 18896]|uniref:UrcA family protein n=1 Tax=Novosphingobium sp. JCM 18896 TaxID=2989731 RepID=UPI0022212B49|nr:UrcA family protein [Novosphingobium sp. JCM 18896]MCW1428988.1 UrcA family protein [Novosphingobium sp. JCM 18896]